MHPSKSSPTASLPPASLHPVQVSQNKLRFHATVPLHRLCSSIQGQHRARVSQPWGSLLAQRPLHHCGCGPSRAPPASQTSTTAALTPGWTCLLPCPPSHLRSCELPDTRAWVWFLVTTPHPNLAPQLTWLFPPVSAKGHVRTLSPARSGLPCHPHPQPPAFSATSITPPDTPSSCDPQGQGHQCGPRAKCWPYSKCSDA